MLPAAAQRASGLNSAWTRLLRDHLLNLIQSRPAFPSAATPPISLYTPPPPKQTHKDTRIYIHTHTPSSPSTGSSLQCHQQHHSSQDSERALQGPPPPTSSPWCGAAVRPSRLRLIGCPSASPPRSCCCCCDVTGACLSVTPVKLNILYITVPCTSTPAWVIADHFWLLRGAI